jgi:hypothetical protein
MLQGCKLSRKDSSLGVICSSSKGLEARIIFLNMMAILHSLDCACGQMTRLHLLLCAGKVTGSMSIVVVKFIFALLSLGVDR